MHREQIPEGVDHFDQRRSVLAGNVLLRFYPGLVAGWVRLRLVLVHLLRECDQEPMLERFRRG